MKQGIYSIQKASVLMTVAFLLVSSVGLAAITNFDNDNGNSRYVEAGNWSKGYPAVDDDARIRYGNDVVIDQDISPTNANRRYNLTVGWQSHDTLTIEKGVVFAGPYKRKLFVGGDNNSNNTISQSGILDLYGKIILTATAKGNTNPYDESSVVLGFGNALDDTSNFGYINVYDGGHLDSVGSISIVKGELFYEAYALPSAPRRDFIVNKVGTVTFETDGPEVATVEFGGGGRAKLNLVNNATSKVKMELSGAFNIGDTWRLFDNVDSNAEANSTPVYSDQGYEFDWIRTVATAAGHDGYVEVTLVGASVVQVLPVSSRDVDPTTLQVEWALGTFDPNGFAYSYDVYFGTDPENLTQYVPNGTETTFTPSAHTTLGSKTDYYVRVDIHDPNNTADPGDDFIITGGAWKLRTIDLDPVVTLDPVDASVDPGEAATFTAAGDLTDGYQWYKVDGAGDIMLVNDGRITGADTETLVIDNVGAVDEGDYYCVLSSNVVPAEVSTKNASLSLNEQIIGPDDVAVDIGDTAQFTVSYSLATGYAWYRDADTVNPIVDGDDISGATTATLSIANAEHADEDNYYCVISIDATPKTSAKASLTINPLIISGPEDARIVEGETAEFTVVASVTADSFEWYMVGDANAIEDGGDISGATTATLTIANAEIADEGDYYCVANNSVYALEETSANANLAINRLVGHWDFENDANDIVGGLEGAFYNGNTKVSSLEPYTDANELSGDPGDMISGNAMKFTGDGTYIRVLDSGTKYNFYPDGFTASAWIRVDNTTVTLNHKLVSKQNSAATRGFHVLTTKARGRVRLYTSSDYKESDNMGPTAHNGKWHFITATSDASQLRLYIDGNLEESVNISTSTIPTHTGLFVIGAANGIGSSGVFDGVIDEVKLYNYALSHDTIAQTYADATGKNACKVKPASDYRGNNCFVDLTDYNYLAERWLNGDDSEKTVADLAVLAEQWLDESNIVEPATE